MVGGNLSYAKWEMLQDLESGLDALVVYLDGHVR